MGDGYIGHPEHPPLTNRPVGGDIVPYPQDLP